MVQNDMETVTGKNVRYILTELDQSDIFKMTKSYIKKNLHFAEVAAEDNWKVDFVKELTGLKQNVLCLPENDHGQFTREEIDDLVTYITTV